MIPSEVVLKPHVFPGFVMFGCVSAGLVVVLYTFLPLDVPLDTITLTGWDLQNIILLVTVCAGLGWLVSIRAHRIAAVKPV